MLLRRSSSRLNHALLATSPPKRPARAFGARLPGAHGVRIREQDPQVPVLLSSGYGASMAKHSSEFSGVLMKPYSFWELLLAVEGGLGEASIER